MTKQNLNTILTDIVLMDPKINLNKITVLLSPDYNITSKILRDLFNSAKKKFDLLNIDSGNENSEIDFSVYVEPITSMFYYNSTPLKLGERLGRLRSMVREEYIEIAISKVYDELERIRNELASSMSKVEDVEEEFRIITRVMEYKDGIDPSKPFSYPALIALVSIYVYALAVDMSTLFIVDSPEAFAYPSLAYAIARVLRRLTLDSPYMKLVIYTNSWDVFAGAYRGDPNSVTTYYIKERNDGVTIQEVDDLYMPGFRVSTLLR